MSVRVIVREAAVVGDASLDELLAVLDDAERARADKKRRPAPFITAHAVARQLLGDLTGRDPRSLSFVRRCTTCGADAHGKPSLVGDDPWRFSLSYTPELVVVAAVHGHEVGVDTEELDEADFDDFDRVTLAPEERAPFAALSGDQLLDARAQVWARKEAVLKATGHGLVVDPTEVLVTGPDGTPGLVDWRAQSAPPGQVAVADVTLASAHHRAAVAVIDAAGVTVETV